ncbi:hypothetical protein [Kribbella jiaozuonensis]|uniref:Uncharacterized protein n=1 Tax=Kribbella jiaozuonensis TaxID=2575441 RepID=A0A4U3LSR7_9ACTN|nr:hypothetical protein [Kribbella jiaozuonensis]TKK77716.1 hypothetical protein FDA38_21470 [Kribbella jiaozuonensis]
MHPLETYTAANNWPHAAAATASRLILRTLQDTVTSFETDIPATSPDWPPTAASAAEVLRGVARRKSRGDYAQTGIIKNPSNEVWSAFVEFAAWAYDATVWNSTGDAIVSLADEAHSIVIRITHHQHTAITAGLAAAGHKRARLERLNQ